MCKNKLIMAVVLTNKKGSPPPPLQIYLKNMSRPSKQKDIYHMDVYLSQNRPLLLETPVLTLTCDQFQRGGRHYFFVAPRHLEYNLAVRQFCQLVTQVKSAVRRQLFQKYNVPPKDLQEQEQEHEQEEGCESLAVEYKVNVTTVYNRFKEPLAAAQMPPLQKHNRAQFILELPSVWFELDGEAKDQIVKIGFFIIENFSSFS